MLEAIHRMPLPIEDYALIGDLHTAALVGKNGAIDWLCLPRFDAGACFCGLLGDDSHGSWSIAPIEPVLSVRRKYAEDTLVLETEFETASGVVRLVDFMPPRTAAADVVRTLVGVRGQVTMRSVCRLRFDYGRNKPWVTREDDRIVAVAGPDRVVLRSPVATTQLVPSVDAEFTVTPDTRMSFVLTWSASYLDEPEPTDANSALETTLTFWREWAGRCNYTGPYREAVVRSLITLKALTYAPTGGVVAAVTTSLPEQWRGPRNWDYRFCWLRDATFTLYAMLTAGYTEEALAWRDWLVRAVAGAPDELQIMYGLAGERRLSELELPWLPGYEGAQPVRIGNGAYEQLQLDVFGEVMDLLYAAARVDGAPLPHVWQLQCLLLAHLTRIWRGPDDGIWEVRGGPQHFTHSKAMAWVAFDRGIKMAERFSLEAPLAAWRSERDAIHAEVCRHGFDEELGAFTQVFGQKALDASLLVLPHLGFLDAHDPRVLGTSAAIAKFLCEDGFVMRYREDAANDGFPPGEGAFLLCTFWMVDQYALAGDYAEAEARFEKLLALRNDVGLLSEQYDPHARRLLGNFPQAFSHVALVNTAFNLASARGPANERHRG